MTTTKAFKIYARRWTNDFDADTEEVIERSEVLTLVRVDGHDGLFVQVTSGDEVGDDFVGLYDLDGDSVDLGNCEWSLVEDMPAEEIEEKLREWDTKDGFEFVK